MAELINKKHSFAKRILKFYQSLQPEFQLPTGTEVLFPYRDPAVKKVLKAYYLKYYHSDKSRIFVFGINPGRLGGGITGIPFTDPVQLKESGIDHSFILKPELSSAFVYDFIKEYGGLEQFAEDFFLTAICPLGFTLNGKNYNYYDDKKLEESLRPWIIKTMNEQLRVGANKNVAICLGEGSNFKYLSELNKEEKWFREIIPLPHPRWIMQYNRKLLNEHIKVYVSTLKDLKGKKYRS